MDDSYYDSDSDTEESSVISNDECVTCHICKVDIPNTYFRAHKRSTIHQYNVKIIGIALKKSREHIRGDNRFDTSVETLVQDYCHICNVYYKGHLKSNHENSDTHKKMLIYEKLIPKIYLLFKDNVKNLNVIDEMKKVFDRTCVKTVKNEEGMTYCDICDVYKNTHGFSGHLKGKKHKKICAAKGLTVEHTKVAKSTVKKIYCDVCGVFKDTSNFNLHENSNKHKKKLRKHNQTNETLNFQIKPKNNDILNIERLTENHFTKYIRSNIPFWDSNLKRCKVCSVTFGSENEVIEHLHSVDHLNKYRNILLNHEIIKLFNEYFCPKCDIFIPDVVEHVQNVHILIVLRGSVTLQYCELCKVNITSGNITAHNQRKSHMLKEEQRANESINFIDVNLDDATEYKTMMTIKHNVLTCKLCDMSLDPEMFMHSVDKHFNGPMHNVNFTEYIVQNNMEIKGDNELRCKLCDKIVERDNAYEHGESKKHKKKKLKKL